MQLLRLLVAISLPLTVVSHGWLVSPCPRSNASPTQAPAVCTVSTGTASTTGPCGKGALTVGVSMATLTQGAPVNVVYERANAHGTTGNDVTITLTSKAAVPSATAAVTLATAAGVTALPMDVTINTPQPPQALIVPANFPVGPAVMQFKWQPMTNGAATGAPWFDCSDVTVMAPSTTPTPCTNSPCSDVCTVTGATFTCSCTPGRILQAGSTTTCVALPAPSHVVMVFTGDLTQPTNGVSGQDTFTANMNANIPSIAAELNFDQATFAAATGQTTVSVFVTADPVTGTPGAQKAAALTAWVQAPNSIPALAAIYKPVSIQIDANAIAVPTTASSTTTKAGATSSSSAATPSSSGAAASSTQATSASSGSVTPAGANPVNAGAGGGNTAVLTSEMMTPGSPMFMGVVAAAVGVVIVAVVAIVIVRRRAANAASAGRV